MMVVSDIEVDGNMSASTTSTHKALADCSDEEYLIMRAKIETEKGNITAAKTWMLTARAIFPNNFDVQFEAYMSEKKAGNVRESAKCFEVLFDNFSKQDKLLDEVHMLMKVLRKKNPESECAEGEDKFYLDMFDNISCDHQKKMIRFAADKASDPLDHCKLMLVLLRKFSEEVSVLGEKLIETINTAENREVGQVGDPLNQFRTILCTEILPTVLSDPRVQVDQKLLGANLLRVQEYVMASALRPGPGAWSLLYNIMASISRLLSWLPTPGLPPVPLTATSLPTEQFLSLITSHGAQRPEGFGLLASLVLHTVSEYTAASQDSILVEAWVTHTSHMDREKNKRRKTQEEGGGNLPELSSHGDSALVSLFRLAADSWSVLTSLPLLESKFQALVSQLGISLGPAMVSMFDNFRVDFKHFYSGGRDVLGLVRSETNSHRPAWQAVKTATLQYCSGDQRSAAQSLMAVVADLASSSDTEEGVSAGLTTPTSKTRHCRFIQLTRPAVLTYCCRLLTSLLQEKAMFPGAGGDLATGHCMVLLQYNWSDCADNRELFYYLLNRVKGKEGFTYPLFCKYVINIEILEEIMHLASEGGGLLLDILPGSWAGGAGARPGTRGANRGGREEFRSAMRRQAARSHENIEAVIVEFLSAEASLILQTLA